MREFGEDTQLQFAGITTIFLKNTLKFGVKIQNWPFLSLTNTLGIVFDSPQQQNQQQTCVDTQEDETGSLQWFLVVVDGVSLYQTFIY